MSAIRTPASADRTLASRNYFVLAVALTILALTFLAIAAEKIGLPAVFSRTGVAIAIMGAAAFVGFRASTSHLPDWLSTSHSTTASIAGIAVAAAMLSGTFMLVLPGMFVSGGPAGPVLISATLLALTLCSMLTVPYLRARGATSPVQILSQRFANRTLVLIATVIAGGASLVLLWAQLRAATLIAGLYLEVPVTVRTLLICLLVGAVVLPGGLFGSVKANVLNYALLGVAVLLPLVWLTAIAPAIPIPQIGAGAAAFADVVSLEQQLRALGISVFTEEMATGWPALSCPVHATAALAVLTAGLAAMPAITAGFQSCQNVDVTRKSGISALVLVTVVITAVPAAAAFTKLGIYKNLFGLTSGEIHNVAAWMFDWSDRMSLFSPGEAMFKICNEAVSGTQAAIEACGGNPDYAIGPADIHLHGELASLALPDIAGLPSFVALLAAAGLVVGCLSAANMAAYSAAVSLAEDGRSALGLPRPTNGARLFLLRVSVLMAISATGLLAAYTSISPVTLTLWAIALSASTIAPVTIAAMWWSRANRAAALGGIAAPCLVLSVFLAVDWLAARPAGAAWMSAADETLPLHGLATPIRAGSLAMIASVIVIVALSFLLRQDIPSKSANLPLGDVEEKNS